MMNSKKTILSIAIAIIFALFVGYGMEVFDPTPNVDDFCPSRLYQLDNQEECLAQGGVWSTFEEGSKVPLPVEHGEGFCEQSEQCREGFNTLFTQHEKRLFIISMVIGVLAVVGAMVLRREPISVGVLSGGFLVLFYGIIRYWRHANSTLKFIVLGFVLAVLLYLAYTKFEAQSKKKK